MGESMNNLAKTSSQVKAILQDYISIHNQIFKPSVRKSITLPGVFKAIDFGKHYDDLGILSEGLEEVISSDDIEQQSIFMEYTEALLRTVDELREICEKLFEKSQGAGNYTMEEYKADVASYQDSAEKYMKLGKDLHRYLAENGIMSRGVSRPKSYMIFKLIFHISLGLLFPSLFLWTKSGILTVILLTLFIQGLDQIRLYTHYQKGFQLADELNGIENSSSFFEWDSILRHSSVLIYKVLWYGMITMVCAGFRR